MLVCHMKKRLQPLPKGRGPKKYPEKVWSFAKPSVPNSSNGLMFVKRRAKRRAKFKFFVILSSFCDLVHVQSVVDLLAKQFITF